MSQRLSQNLHEGHKNGHLSENKPDLSVLTTTNIIDEDNECWDDAKDAFEDNNSCPKIDNQEEDELRLHKAIFENDAHQIYEILSSQTDKSTINRKDKHGNTALHLACMLGRSKEIISNLLQNGAGVDIKNINRWTPFHEACSYGNRDIITLITKQLKDDVYDAINRNKLSENLEKIKNYRLVLNWEFQSWVPFLSRVLPSDVCVITKQDKYLRIDTRMLDFEMLSWKKGDSCLVYSNKFEKKWIIMNNKTKKYQHFETQNVDKNVDEKVDEFMCTDIMDFELKSSDIQLTRSTCGWIWKADRMEKVGKYNASLYNFSNLFVVTRKRREHMKDDDVKRNKMAYKTMIHIFKYGMKPKTLDEIASHQDNDNDNDNEGEAQEAPAEDSAAILHRESLAPPPPTNVTWREYIQSEPGKFPNLGREQKCKVLKTPFKACVAMSEEFPITKNEFLDLLSIVPLKLFKKLKEFIEIRLPEGFPVRLDIPVLPFLTARITFEDFAFLEGAVDESLFSIPSDYEEDPNLFPFLGGRANKNNDSNNETSSGSNKNGSDTASPSS